MMNRRGDEENEDRSSKEKVGDLGDGPVFEESDVPVLRLYECVHQRRHLSAPWSGWRWRTENVGTRSIETLPGTGEGKYKVSRSE